MRKGGRRPSRVEVPVAGDLFEVIAGEVIDHADVHPLVSFGDIARERPPCHLIDIIGVSADNHNALLGLFSTLRMARGRAREPQRGEHEGGNAKEPEYLQHKGVPEFMACSAGPHGRTGP